MSSSVKLSLVFLMLGFAAVVAVLVGKADDRPPLAKLVLCFLPLPIDYLVSAKLQLRALKNSPAWSKSAEIGVPESGSEVSAGARFRSAAFSENKFSELAALSRPRKVTLVWKGRVYVLLVSVGAGLFTVYGLPAFWSAYHDLHAKHVNDWRLWLSPIVVYGYSLAFFRNRLRERQLLSDGEVASGYITAQSDGHYIQSVQYNFKLPGGDWVAGGCRDASRSVYEGMTVPIFYDPLNPKRNVALDCSLTKLDPARK